MLVVFLILFGILAKYAWPAIVRMMDERADFIDKGVEYAREAKRDREKAQEDAKDLLTEARKQPIRGIAADRTAETGDDSGGPKSGRKRGKTSEGGCQFVDRAGKTGSRITIA